MVGRNTWNALTDVYLRTIASLPPEYSDIAAEIYPGRALSLGTEGEDVRRLQSFINIAADNYSYIPRVTVDGAYGPATRNAILRIQENNGISPTGVTGSTTWYTVVRLAGIEG